MLVGLLVAVAAAVAVGGTKPASSGFARAQVLIDTPKSQLVDTAPAGADTLAWRAKLLAHLTAAEPEKRQLAAAVGIRPDELAVVDPDLAIPEIASSLPKAASQIAGMTAVPYILTVRLPNDTIPVISFEAVAPTRAEADRLARAGIAGVRSEIPAKEQGAPAEDTASDPGVPDPDATQAFAIRDVGPVRGITVVQRGLPIKGIGAAIFVFALWTLGVAFLPVVARALRRHGLQPA
jgi:hypothetical protein